jgi:glucose-1-phosphate thymidylyltransferase
MKFYGLIPAGGIGSRLGKLPVSKEVYPILRKTDKGKNSVLCENLIRYYRLAGIRDIHFIIRKGKWDIIDYLGDGSEFGVHISYLIMNLPHGTPFTIDQAYPFVKDDHVALGFPDLIYSPETLFVKLKEKLIETKADIVLGLCPVEKHSKVDKVDFDGNKITNIIIKQDRPELKYGWTNAVWGPSFTQFLHSYLQDFVATNKTSIKLSGNSERELYVGDIVLDAINKGYTVDYLIFEEGSSVDLGTSDDLSSYLSQVRE